MALQDYLSITKRIRTHALVVGVILQLEAIATSFVFAPLQAIFDKFSQNDFPDQLYEDIMTPLVILFIVNALCAMMFLVGFIKRLRWCLIVCVGCIMVDNTVYMLLLFAAIVVSKIAIASVMLIVLVVKAYMLLVILLLRKNLDLTLQQNEISAQANIPSATLQP